MEGLFMPKSTKLANRLRWEQLDSLSKLDDRALCEMVQTHFRSHPCLSGQKDIKDLVNQHLAIHDSEDFLSSEERVMLQKEFAITRIRETKLDHASTSQSNLHTAWANNGQVDPDTPRDMTRTVKVTLAAKPSGKVAVLLPGDQYRELGELPESFVRNNPMNVPECSAEMSITDYSAGKGTTINATVVVDTDLMSGDVLDLNAEDLADLSEDYNLEK